MAIVHNPKDNTTRNMTPLTLCAKGPLIFTAKALKATDLLLYVSDAEAPVAFVQVHRDHELVKFKHVPARNIDFIAPPLHELILVCFLLVKQLKR